MRHEGLDRYRALFLSLISSFILLGISSSLYSCPSFLYLKDLGKIKTNIKTKDLSLYSYSETTNTWKQENLDIEKVDSLSQIDMPTVNDTETNALFNNNIRLVFEFNNTTTDRFNPNPSSKEVKNLPCENPSFMYEIYSPRFHSYLYLTDCAVPSTSSNKQTVFNDVKKNMVYSTFFKFFHYPQNHVAFKDIQVMSKDKTRFISAADNSVLTIYLDIKYFLTIELSASSLYSEVHSWFTTPQQKIADLSFFWKLLCMNIDVNMKATASFYKESLFVPFRMNVPAEARKYLNKTSGSLYSWKTNDIISYDMSGASIPIFNINDINKSAHIKTGQKYCQGKRCKFSLNGKGPDFNFSAYFAMDKTMVDLGFFPYLVKDEAQTRHELGWDSEINSSLKDRVGIYLNIAGLKSGDYVWDFWIDVDKDKTNLSAVCPSPVRVSPVFISG